MEITIGKVSQATVSALNENGDSVNVTGSIVNSVEDTTDKTNTPITKQSVLDIFNKQFLERINLLPKYSRDYFYVGTGDPDTDHNQGIHSSLYNTLGNAVTGNEYGITCMHDYIRLSDFRDQDGNITIDDMSNTFARAVQEVSRLAKYKITVMKGNRKHSEKEVYAILNNGNPNMINFNSYKNSIVGTFEFNNTCKGWYQKALTHAEEAQQRKEYVYHLPDPPAPANGGVKLIKLEATRGRVNQEMHNRQNTNAVQIDLIFAHGHCHAHFLIPKVSRNLRGVKIRKTYRIRQQGLYLEGYLINKNSGVIIANFPLREVHPPSGSEDIIYFDQVNTTLSNQPTDDLIFKLGVQTSGDPGDAMAIVLEIVELIFDDGYTSVPLLNTKQPTGIDVTREVIGPEHYYVNELYAGGSRYSYTVKNFTFKPVYITARLNGSQKDRIVFDRIEVWRNGQRIGVSSPNRFIDYPRESITNSVSERSAYNANWNYNYDPVLVSNVSGIDIRNGDVLVFNFLFGDIKVYDSATAINIINKKNHRFEILDIFCNHVTIA